MTKICSKCNESRELVLFSKDSRNKDGLQSQCQICRKAHKNKVALERRGLVTVESKCCNSCNKTKPASEFFKDSGISDGLATICKECKNITMNKWRAENRDRYNANMRQMRATNKEMFKNIDLKRTYGITLETYNAMFANQNGVCAICSKPQQGKRPLVVDHDHKTGEVRQLLCYGCNRALHVLENSTLLQQSVDYLKRHKI